MLKNMSFTLRKNLKLNATFIHKIKIILDSFLSPHFHNCRGGGGVGRGKQANYANDSDANDSTHKSSQKEISARRVQIRRPRY